MRRPARAVVVRNTPDLSRMRPGSRAGGRDRGSQRTLLYVGILTFDRGVDLAVRAMAHVVGAIPEARLVIVGDGPERPRLDRLVGELGLGHAVELAGWKEPDQIEEYYDRAAVGLLPVLDTPHIRTTLANKLFDYMAHGLAVIAADVPPMRKILNATNAGVLVACGDVVALAHAAVELLRDLDAAGRLGQRGRAAVVAEFNWGVDGRRFGDAVRRDRDIVRGPPNGAHAQGVF
jgi:glycosyltransferase involved in cell wall biosynthesis